MNSEYLLPGFEIGYHGRRQIRKSGSDDSVILRFIPNGMVFKINQSASEYSAYGVATVYAWTGGGWSEIANDSDINMTEVPGAGNQPLSDDTVAYRFDMNIAECQKLIVAIYGKSRLDGNALDSAASGARL